MYTYFDASFFIQNRARLRELCPDDAPIVIAANGRMQKSMDIAFPFRQDGNFWYLTGINEPDMILVIDEDETYLLAPEQSDYLSHFYGQAEQANLRKVSGIETVLLADAGWQKLARRIKKTHKVHSMTPPPDYIDVYGMYTNPARKVLVEKLQSIEPSIEVADIRSAMASLRMVKHDAELGALRAAIDLTVDAFKHVGTQQYKTEKEIEAAFSIYFLSHGQYDHAYDPIVAAGKNACTMHTSSTRATMHKNDLVLIDIGAEVDSYTADITRVFPLSKPTKRQREVHQAVRAVQDYAISNLKPGISIRENEKLVEAFMGEQMMELGLIKKPTREAIRQFYPHSTSHFLGRDIHDLGDYDAPLAPNMVLTVEPGIYIPEESIGIRIEDDLLITEQGNEVLSQKLPRDL